ncbi:glycosyltransferase [Rhodanobacter sp. Col0626]|uniref:glycosyltransferase n=1 Tax=Rhodanobacter sp. Col0626 TaxID=3415679 RepID=UPI003CF467F1
MRIVLDLQGAQSHSRHRGIGRYSLSMSKAFAAAAGEHELWLALNGRQNESSLSLIEQFGEWIPRERMLINELPPGIAGCHPDNRWRTLMGAAAQANFLANVQADCIWHSSLFEGWGDESTAALGTGTDDDRHVATLYDLIPLLNPTRHLRDAAYRRWYYRRLGLLKRCGLLLTISESSRREAIDQLQIKPDKIVVVSGAADPVFRPMPVDAAGWARWQNDWGLRPGFVLYAGGYDAHKNVDTLIAAYAGLPVDLRELHPLVLAGRCDASNEKQLRGYARKLRLADSSVIFTGALDDAELARLYSSCTVFVSPSLHEGLGLPLLEAMACGAAVIGSNTTSLPEVIGCPEALFDPRSRSSMAAKLHAVLTERGFVENLREHAAVQVRKFDWPGSARKALAAIERHARDRRAVVRLPPARPRLFYVSPLPPLRSGIADYSAHLLRELASHYEIEVVVDQLEVIDPWVQANFPIRSVDWFQQQDDAGARVLYHFGNSPFHAHMFSLLRRHSGTVVLHDSWLGAARNWMANDARDPGSFLRLLYDSHGYAGLLHDRHYGRVATLDAWPVNRDVIDHALGVIVHSDYAVQQAQRFYGIAVAAKFTVVPFPKARTHGDRRVSRRLLGLDPDDFVVCSFGMLAPTKLNHRLLTAWLQSSLATDARCHLIFVGENDGGDYGQTLAATIASVRSGVRIRITGFVSAQGYADYLDAADVVVQLRTDSRGETSAAVFDALAHGLPLIVNAHGTAMELPATAAIRIADHFSDDELTVALQGLKESDARRAQLAADAAQLVQQRHHPAEVALQYRDAIERFVGDTAEAEQQRLLTGLQRTDARFAMDGPAREELLQVLAANRPRMDRPHVYVDVTATAASELRTGIERVVHGVLSALLQHGQVQYRIEPVRLHKGRYVLAADYALRVLEHAPIDLPEDEVVPRAGDILLGLDWVADALPANAALLDAWRVRGVRMVFVVYDLLPVRHPQWFPDGIATMHATWLNCIGQYADALLCISRFVADDVRRWFDEHPPLRDGRLPLGYFYPGNDPAAARPSAGLPPEAQRLLRRLRSTPSFLMVGTIEPRKGHALVLDAFERLWAEGIEANLVVVGREGWMSDALAARMRLHAHAGTRLVWLERASDEYLEQVYDAARALVAASEGEGFGLPLVEAARRGLPVIARDIPVFREVSSTFARYFDDVDELTRLLREAMKTDRPAVEMVADTALGWKETTGQVWRMLMDVDHSHWLTAWMPHQPTPRG